MQKIIDWGEVVEYRDGKLYWKINTFSGRYHNHPAAVAGAEAGTMKSRGYFHFNYQGKHHQRHVVIWNLFNGEVPEGFVVDHIKSVAETGGVADDRIENLQVISVGRNIRKGSGSSPNSTNKSSSRRGVSYDKKYAAKPWRARIRVGDTTLCLNFENFDEAVSQRERWESEYC